MAKGTKKLAYGAVIKFPIGTTKQEADEAVRLMREKFFAITVDGPREYDPELGSPVWYIP